MKQTVLKIALAGLMHDIGKFTQGGMDVSKKYANDNADQYQPFNKKTNHHTHVHALYTAAFIEQYADQLPMEFNRAEWGDGDSFVNLSAGHHQAETAMQECIAQADHLSSGLDRAEFKDQTYIPFTQYRSTRLLSVLEALSPDDNPRQKEFEKSASYTSSYPLSPLSAKSIFPIKRVQIEKYQARADYQNLFDGFISKIGTLPHRNNPELWGQHFDSLLACHTSQIPAARVGSVVPDVSLYDHCRTTAALAVPLYMYHLENDSLNLKDIGNQMEKKFLLVSGDFYGIQDFIFASGGEQQRLRAKLLRGRSFAVSLFSELAADTICRATDLPFTAVFLNAAGKFHLLAPNTAKIRQIIRKETERLNKWLYSISSGQASLGITSTPAAATNFNRGGFLELWEEHMLAMDRRKYQRLGMEQYGVVEGFLNTFSNKLEKPLCPFCGKRPSEQKARKDMWLDKQGNSCAVCRDHIMLGANLVKGKTLAIFHGGVNASKSELLLEPFFKNYQLRFYEEGKIPAESTLIKFWQLGVNVDGSIPTGGTSKLLNGYVPLYSEDILKNNNLYNVLEKDGQVEDIQQLIKNRVPVTFNGIASLAKNNNGKGTTALGILKVDVDHLGMLMSCGMAKERFTISRMATLSRRLDQFFSLYLPYLLNSKSEFQGIYTVFAGGDDLILIGPWNKMADLASELRKQWSMYVSGNDKAEGLTFSAGITLHKTHEPVDKLAESAEEALKEAKEKGRNRITMFGETVGWDEFDALQEKQQTMAAWVENGLISKVMFYRFNDFIEMAGKARQITNGVQQVHIRDMECLKWPALLCYSLERNILKKGKKREESIKEVVRIKNWLEEHGSALKIALWSRLYEQR